jgi:uncharacterized protein (DUF1778 family)
MALVEKKMQQRGGKIQRIEARLTPDQKSRIEYAASLKRKSVSEFIISSADSAAVEAIEKHESWTLSREDQKRFVGALLRPPAPNKRLKAAVVRYKRLVANS